MLRDHRQVHSAGVGSVHTTVSRLVFFSRLLPTRLKAFLGLLPRVFQTRGRAELLPDDMKFCAGTGVFATGKPYALRNHGTYVRFAALIARSRLSQITKRFGFPSQKGWCKSPHLS